MYIFETSWEVCNRVGGIYAVLSTRAASMQRIAKDKVFFFGPDIERMFGGTPSPYFTETKSLLPTWQKQAEKAGLRLRIGRWEVPGRPIAILLDSREMMAHKDEIYAHAWEKYEVKSHAAYGDYDESSMFGHYAGMAMESLYRYLVKGQESRVKSQKSKVKGQEEPFVAHFNEWQTAFGLFYLKEHCPEVGTLFTTHATGIGRSIAGNNKPLYDYFEGYNGNQMAEELNMVSKHSAERQAAHFADCFTTVSNITAKECKQLLDRPVDIVTPNGFEPDFVPKGAAFTAARERARHKLREVAEQVMAYQLPADCMFVCTSGRYEWRNKGIDATLYSLRALRDKLDCIRSGKTIVAYILVPAWQNGAKEELGRDDYWTTHRLVNPSEDPVIRTLHELGLYNRPQSRVKVIFVPSYLNGNDGIFNMPYYDLLIGMDATIFPSYYEPWGYTPLESNAFHVPTITTDKAGYGMWIKDLGGTCSIEAGAQVIHRTDSNWGELIASTADALFRFSQMTPEAVETARKSAAEIAEQAEWKHFFTYYEQAYDIALKHNKENRKKQTL